MYLETAIFDGTLRLPFGRVIAHQEFRPTRQRGDTHHNFLHGSGTIFVKDFVARACQGGVEGVWGKRSERINKRAARKQAKCKRLVV